MGTQICEQETIIRWYRDEKEATIYTSDYLMMNRFDGYVAEGEKENATSYRRAEGSPCNAI